MCVCVCVGVRKVALIKLCYIEYLLSLYAMNGSFFFQHQDHISLIRALQAYLIHLFCMRADCNKGLA